MIREGFGYSVGNPMPNVRDFSQIQWFPVQGRRMACRITGSGPNLLLLHGGFQTSQCWRRLAKLMSEHHTLVVPDLPGLGRSEALADFEMQSISSQIGALLDTLNVDSCAVAGHDLGGAIGVMLGLTRPALVSRLIFLDMLIPGFGFEEAWIPRPEGRFLWFGALNSVPGVIESLLPGKEREYIDLVLRTTSVDFSSFDLEDRVEYGNAYEGGDRLAVLGGYFRAMWANARRFQELHSNGLRLSMPSLAAGGQFSTGHACGQSLSAFAPAAEKLVIEHCGHWLPEEKTGPLAVILKEFLS